MKKKAIKYTHTHIREFNEVIHIHIHTHPVHAYNQINKKKIKERDDRLIEF